MILFKEVRNQDWFKKTEMMGHVWGKENIELIESHVNEENYDLFSNIFVIDCIDWHYFCNSITKSYINRAVKLSKIIYSKKKISYEKERYKLCGCLSNSRYFAMEDAIHRLTLLKIKKLDVENGHN